MKTRCRRERAMRTQSLGALLSVVVAVAASASCLVRYCEAFAPVQHPKWCSAPSRLSATRNRKRHHNAPGLQKESTRRLEKSVSPRESDPIESNEAIDAARSFKPEFDDELSNVNVSVDEEYGEWTTKGKVPNSSADDSEEEYGVWTAIKEKTPLPGAQAVERFLSEPLVEITVAYLVIVSSVLVAIATLPLNAYWQTTIEDWQNAIAYTFVLEFVVRWYSSWRERGIFRYLSQPLVFVDVVVVILPVLLPLLAGMPPWLSSQQGLINLRLLRVLRLQRVLKDLDTFSSFTAALGLGDVKQVQLYQLQLARVILSLFTLLSVTSGLIYAAEHGINPDIKNYFSALYFALSTLSTVGFGDITPVTFQGKLVVCGSILAGVTVIPAQAGKLVESLMNAQSERELEQRTMGTRTGSSSVLPPNQWNSPEMATIEEQHAETVPNALDELPRRNSSMLPSSSVDAVTPCPSCGATFHWTSARYCWSCGSALSETFK